jgi:dUTP pyrophosphatase
MENGQTSALTTGIAFELSNDTFASIRPRSGLSSKGIIISNSPGTIDSDYKGEVKVLLMNLSGLPYEIRNGNRIAQIIFEGSNLVDVVFEMTNYPKQPSDQSARGSRGFGSSGR